MRSRGISFELHFDGIYGVSGTEYFVSRVPAASGVGKFGKSDLVTPQWAAETDDGTSVRLYGVKQIPETFRQSGSDGSSVGSSFSGTALFAIVDIPTNRLLAFPHSTREDFRMFFSGHAGWNLPTKEEVSFETHTGTQHTTMRASIELRTHPRVCLLNSYGYIKSLPSGWLSFEEAPTPLDCEIGAFAEQTFVSFLHGEKVAFHWADRQIDAEGIVRRSYYGSAVSAQHGQSNAVYQPLPFLSGVEPFQYGDAVLQRLPQFFERFCTIYSGFNFAVALHPLWTALHSVLQDRIALAALSLERVASYWRSYKKSPKSNQNTSVPQSIWDQKGSLKKFRRFLSDCLNKWLINPAKAKSFSERVKCSLIDKVLEFSGDPSVKFRSEGEKKEFIDVLKKRIENITQAPNGASLRNPYLDVGLSISTDEQEALNARNLALHGHARSNQTIEEFNDDALTFDHLRMLITKFVLQLCDYDGPFIDYASPPTAGNFVVRSMSEVTVDSHKVSVVKSHDE